MTGRFPTVLLALSLGMAGCTAATSVSPSPLQPLASVTAPTAPTSTATTTPAVTASSSPEPQAPTCRATAQGLSLREQAGQLLMVGVNGSLDEVERTAITKYHVGSVILMGTSTAGVKRTAALTGQLAKLGGETGVLVAVDQEGGLVQRLQGPGFSTIPSAAMQAKLSDATLRQRAEGWGEELAAAGVHLNLAPVADVVPAAK